MPVSREYTGVRNILARYWSSYGGAKALVGSPYLHFSLFITLLLYPYWTGNAWWNLALEILPSLLGFSLAGYAIWLGFGDDRFRKLITSTDESTEVSPYMQVSATFAHFVTLQMAALLCAVVATATQFPLTPDSIIGRYVYPYVGEIVPNVLAPAGYFIGFLLFIYAMTSAFAAALAVFRVASWFDTTSRSEPKD